MKSNVKFNESVQPLHGMLKGIAEMTYKQKLDAGIDVPTYTVQEHPYPYIHVRGTKVLFNQFGMALYIQKTPVDGSEADV